jgi:hypothetical protein
MGLSLIGYRGFTIAGVSSSFANIVKVCDGIVDIGSGQASVLDSERGLERWLLDSVFAGDLEAPVASLINKSLSQSTDELIQRRLSEWAFLPPAAVCELAKAKDAPKYNPGRWNFCPVQDRNSCYNYANDQILCQEAVPGVASGVNITFSCCGLIEGASGDGLRLVKNSNAPLRRGEGWYVAVATCPDLSDFHFYRQDALGCWSHKVGDGEVTNIDDTHQVITNPETAILGDYHFCAYLVTNRHVTIG